MGNLSLSESQHAPAPNTGRAAYIPPHLRQRQMGAGASANANANANANMDGAAPPPNPAGSWGPPRYVSLSLLCSLGDALAAMMYFLSPFWRRD